MALRIRYVVGAAAVAFIAAALVSEGVKTDPESVRKYALERVAAQFRNAEVRALDADEFEIVHPNGRRAIGNLAAAQDTCQRTPRRCLDAVDDLLIGLMDWLEGDPLPAPERLRAVVKARAAVEQVVVTPAADGGAGRPLFAPLAGDVVIAFELASSTTSTPLTEPIRARLGIPTESLATAAIDLLETKTPEPALAPVFGALGIHELRGPLPASQLLSRARVGVVMRGLRARTLAASLPSRDHVFVVDADNPAALRLLASMTARMFKEAAHPLSSEVYGVTPTGWTVLDTTASR